ncbi:MAG: right-handed parallel beta-helix repeat-containing protein [Bacteroidota bacterium]
MKLRKLNITYCNVRLFSLLVLIVVGLSNKLLFAKTYKVGEDQKFKTIQSTLSLSKSGDTVLVFEGIYHESVVIPRSGSKGEPIVILTNPGDKVILDGSIILTGWEKCKSLQHAQRNPNWENIYWINAPKGSNRLSLNLFQNDLRLFVAQMPEAINPFYDENTTEWIKSSTEKNSYTHSSIIDKENLTQAENDFWNGAYAKIVSGNNEVFIQKIVSYSASENQITFEPLNADTVELEPGKDVYAISNHLSLVDKPGEIYFDEVRRKIFIIPFDTTSVNKSITASTKQYAFKVKDKSNIIIDGFVIQKYFGVSIDLKNCSNIQIRNCEIRDGIIKEDGGIGPSIYAKKASYCIVDSCFIHHNKHVRGIIFSDGHHNIIINSRFTHTGGTAIDYYGESNSSLIGNYLYDCIGQHANGLTCYLGCKNILIQNNIVINSNIGLTFYDIDGLKVVNNIFHGVDKYPPAACWEQNNNTSTTNVFFYNNILIGSGKRHIGLFSLSTLPSLTMKNNIMDGNVFANENISHNLYTALAEGQDKSEVGAIYLLNGESQIFVNHEKYNYKLKKNSPAIDTGTDVNIDYDMEGKSRPTGKAIDIGPYEK